MNPQSEEQRCAEAKKFELIDQAFRAGDLEALRAAVGDPSVIPNGEVHTTIGSCLVYAIHHSPLAFIRTLLEIGVDPKAPVLDGFPPLIAALSCMRVGGTRRLEIAPHMAYGDAGIPGVIPPAVLLRVEITILAALPPWTGRTR